MLAADPLAKVLALKVVEMLDQQAIHGLLYVDDAMLYQTPTGHVERTLLWAKSLPPISVRAFGRYRNWPLPRRKRRRFEKFALSHPDTRALQQFAESVEQELGLACEWSWHDQVDIAQAGNCKGKRLAQWVAAQGPEMKDVLAPGDNYNDLSMLESVGLGVAMGNADEAIKAHAGRVIGTNLEPGNAETIRRELL